MSIQILHEGNFYVPSRADCMFIALVCTKKCVYLLDRPYEKTVRDLMLSGY